MLSGFFWIREEVTTRIYREKLQDLSQEYAALADRYNHAVKQSAVTELEVTQDSLSVVIRTIEGTIRRFDTPYNPKNEIFVDYIVGNGRIWIRRIFDESTPPEDAMVIDPLWEVVDWKMSGLDYGKIVYRSLEPGLWSIQVSGNGSLSLEPVDSSRIASLQAAPDLRRFEEIRLSLDREVENISLGDIFQFCINIFTTQDNTK